MHAIGFHPEALAELIAAVSYYDEQAPGLGIQFIDELEAAIHLVAEQPDLGMLIEDSRGLRRWILQRFPFYLIFRSDPGRITVLAVAHQRKQPGYWQNRR